MVNWTGRGERRDGERGVDGAGVAGPEDSMDEIVGGPLLEGRERGVVWRNEHVCP